MASVLHSAGYTSLAVGKWHLGHVDALPRARGFDGFFGIPFSHDMDCISIGVCNVPLLNRIYPGLPLFQNEQIVQQPVPLETLGARFEANAVSFIEQHRADPFFLYFAFPQPHTPVYSGAAFLNTTIRGPYGDAVAEIDHSVGVVVDTLQRLGLREDTLVIFASDNGPWLAQGDNGGSPNEFRGGKGQTWEGGYRVPGIASWPGTIPPSDSYGIQSFLDLLPTLVDILQLPPSTAAGLQNEGMSLWQHWQDPTSVPSPRESVFYYYGHLCQALRFRQWKMHIYTRAPFLEHPHREEVPLLFNINYDPGEKRPLPDDAEPDTRALLWSMYEAHVVANPPAPAPSQFTAFNLFAAPCCKSACVQVDVTGPCSCDTTVDQCKATNETEELDFDDLLAQLADHLSLNTNSARACAPLRFLLQAQLAVQDPATAAALDAVLGGMQPPNSCEEQ